MPMMSPSALRTLENPNVQIEWHFLPSIELNPILRRVAVHQKKEKEKKSHDHVPIHCRLDSAFAFDALRNFWSIPFVQYA